MRTSTATRGAGGRWAAGALAATALLVLPGCSAGDGAAAAPAAGGSATATKSATATGSPTTAPPAGSTAGRPTTGARSSSGAAGGPPAVTATAIGVTTLPPVAAGAAADFGDGLVATVTSTDAVQLGASGPGEVAGPGVAVHVALHNGTRAPVDLDGLTVNASYGGGTPADPSSSAPAAPATGVLAPGADADGTWVFSVPATGRASLRVEIGSTSSENVVVVQR